MKRKVPHLTRDDWHLCQYITRVEPRDVPHHLGIHVAMLADLDRNAARLAEQLDAIDRARAIRTRCISMLQRKVDPGT